MRLFARASNGQSVVLVHGTIGAPVERLFAKRLAFRRPCGNLINTTQFASASAFACRRDRLWGDPLGAGRHVQAMGWWDQFVNSNDTSICEGAWKVLFLFKVQHQRLQ